MSDLQRTGVRLVAEDADKFKQDMDKAKKQVTGFGQATLQSSNSHMIAGANFDAMKMLVVAGAGAIVAAGASIVRAWNEEIEQSRVLIATVDDLSDRYGIATKEAGALVNLSNIMGVSQGALAMAFRTMARQGIDPTLDGLLLVKQRLDATSSPAERTALSVKLLGRSGLELAETLALDESALAKYIAQARNASAVNDKMTDAQDEYNRSLGNLKNQEAAAMTILTGSSLSLKNRASLLLENAKLTILLGQASMHFGIADGIATRGLEEGTRILVIAQGLEEKGISVRGMTMDQILQQQANQEGLNHTMREWNDIALTSETIRPVSRAAVQAGKDLVEQLERARGTLDGIIGMVSSNQYGFIKPKDAEQAAWLAQHGLPEIDAAIQTAKDNAAGGLISPEALSSTLTDLATMRASLLIMSGEPINRVSRDLAAALEIPVAEAKIKLSGYVTDLTALSNKHFLTYLDIIATLKVPHVGGYQHGGSFTIGGRSGPDKNLVAFWGTKGERVDITPAGMTSNSYDQRSYGAGKTVIFQPTITRDVDGMDLLEDFKEATGKS